MTNHDLSRTVPSFHPLWVRKNLDLVSPHRDSMDGKDGKASYFEWLRWVPVMAIQASPHTGGCCWFFETVEDPQNDNFHGAN